MRNQQDTLEDIIWGMEASAGEFSLTFVRCNYPELRDRLMESLHEKCSLRVRTVELNPDVIRLSDALSDAVEADPPDALMVKGFESLVHLGDVLAGANLARDTFRDKFPFPLVLWMDDQVALKLNRIAPDFQNWAGIPSRIRPLDDDLTEMLERNAAVMQRPAHSGKEKTGTVSARWSISWPDSMRRKATWTRPRPFSGNVPHPERMTGSGADVSSVCAGC